MAYNKTKLVESAQRFLNQGKIAQAISEYQQILRHEPKDQITLMTVGDLYVRLGETFQAVEYFERLAQIFLSDGFVTKAIAIYKKIAKLTPDDARALEKLAELYIQQGVMSEARPIFLQLAEAHLKSNRHAEAATLLRKLLEAEPDNLRVQMRLADLYVLIGRGNEAAVTLVAAAQRLLERGEHAEAAKLADRALKLDAKHTGAITLKARALAASGKHAEAARLLETLPELDAHPEATALLLEHRLESGDAEQAAKLATKILEREPKNHAPVFRVASVFVESGDLDRALDLLGRIRELMVEAGEHEQLATVLQAAAQRSSGRVEPFEWLVDLYGRTNDSFRLPNALAQLAQAAEGAGEFERAQQTYERLLDLSPEDEAVRRRYDEFRKRMGLAPLQAPVERPVPREPLKEPEVEAKPVPTVVEPPLDEETLRYISQALTDVDLFSSYGLTQKAMDILEAILQRAPRHAVSLEKLLDLHLGAGDQRRTAELAGKLEQIHRERGDQANSERFGELRRRFEKVAEALPEQEAPPVEEAPAPPEVPMPVVEAQPEPAEAPPVGELEALPSGESAVHEVDLSDEWAQLSKQVDAGVRGPVSEPAPMVEARAEEPSAVEAQPVEPPAEAPAEAAPEYELEPAETPRVSSDDFLSELARELNLAVPTLKQDAGTAGSAAQGAEDGGGPLREVFDEFRAELGEMGGEDEDLETHYNLGIAYREMGLLEEAISEFQKVAKANDKGQAFRYAMQCCTLLGLAFMEKGQPAIAAMWYERALQTPGLDQESILALRYDLGLAQELAGDPKAALKSFSQVYAMNIDYRDVAERIATLEKGR